MLSRPAEAERPYSVLCGPRSTSIRSMSDRSAKARARNWTGTSSICTATLGSTLGEKAKVPMPRIETEALTGCSAGRMISDGAALVRSENCRTPCAWSASPVSTCTASGTSWTRSARFCAVTMMSVPAESGGVPCSASAGLVGAGSFGWVGAACANAALLAATAMLQARMRPSAVVVAKLMSFPPICRALPD
jgi:hypothetical protein